MGSGSGRSLRRAGATPWGRFGWVSVLTVAVGCTSPAAPPTATPAPFFESLFDRVPDATRLNRAGTLKRQITADSAPCEVGQLKAHRRSGWYHPPSHDPDYARTREVECFDTVAAAEAAGYRKSPRAR